MGAEHPVAVRLELALEWFDELRERVASAGLRCIE
jgi:hypothetical protein